MTPIHWLLPLMVVQLVGRFDSAKFRRELSESLSFLLLKSPPPSLVKMDRDLVVARLSGTVGLVPLAVGDYGAAATDLLCLINREAQLLAVVCL
jgi:hypothetical protein